MNRKSMERYQIVLDYIYWIKVWALYVCMYVCMYVCRNLVDVALQVSSDAHCSLGHGLCLVPLASCHELLHQHGAGPLDKCTRT